MAAPVEELPEIQVSSKTQTPEQINAVLSDLGYAVEKVEEVSQQPTPDETAEATTKAEETAAADEQKKAEDDAAKEETERKTRNQRRRESNERREKELQETRERAERLERELTEVRAAQTKTDATIEEMRRNPPQPAKEDPLPELPKRPVRADFMDSDDPEAAYDDAFYDYRQEKAKVEALIEERKNPKPKADPAPAAAPAVAATPTYSDDELKTVKRDKIEDPTLRRFFDSMNNITEKHPGAYKAIVDNVPKVNDAIVQATNTFDEPARIALYLAKHPEDSKRIKALTDGNVKDNPSLIRKAVLELAKIEELATAEDAAPPATPEGTSKEEPEEEPEDDSQEPDPEEDLSAARHSEQPQRTEPAAPKPEATPQAPKKQKKHDPVAPVGARGTAPAKRYEDLTPAEQRALPIEKVREMRGML